MSLLTSANVKTPLVLSTLSILMFPSLCVYIIWIGPSLFDDSPVSMGIPVHNIFFKTSVFRY